MNIVIAAVKPWSIKFANEFASEYTEVTTHIVTDKSEIASDILDMLQPDYVFFTHWSWYIPATIFDNYTCVIFHPSDVPFGRGGSPIQNLIADGYTETIISALKAGKELDAGDIFLKRKLSLLGGGEEIMLRMQSIIFKEMIPYIIEFNPVPTPQSGNILEYRRRMPTMGELTPNMPLEKLFDIIRMLDIEGYPNAFIRFGDYKLTFARPALYSKKIRATVDITGEDSDV